MISDPDTMRRAFARRQVSPSPRRMTASQAAARAVFMAVAIALSLHPCTVAVAGDAIDALQGAASDSETPPVRLFVEITSTRLAEEFKAPEARRVDLAGVPVMIGALRQDANAASSVAAGIAAEHDFTLGDHLTLQASGKASRAHVMESGVLSAARIGGDLALRYKADGTEWILRPSLLAALQDDVLDHVAYGIEGDWRQEISRDLDLTLAAGSARHDAVEDDSADRETGFGRFGLHLDLAKSTEFELGYQIETRDGPLASQFRMTQGPVVAAHLAPGAGWRLTGRYRFSATERGYDDSDATARHRDELHRLDLESEWALSSSTGAAWHMTAKYGFELTDSETAASPPPTHIAGVSFALKF